MKRLLFVSPSQLTLNLLRAVLPLVPEKTDLVSITSFEGLSALPKKGKNFDLVLIDAGAGLSPDEYQVHAEFMSSHPLLQRTRRIALSTSDALPGWQHLQGIADFHLKPLSPTELAGVIHRGTKEGSR